LKPLIFILVLFLLVCLTPLMVIFLNPTPLRESPIPVYSMTADEATKFLEWDIELHKRYLPLPPTEETGSYEWHLLWIGRFEQTIRLVHHKPSLYTKDEAIEFLKLAQMLHVRESPTYKTQMWHYRWFQIYEGIINYMER
jgi:hypothetical protein